MHEVQSPLAAILTQFRDKHASMNDLSRQRGSASRASLLDMQIERGAPDVYPCILRSALADRGHLRRYARILAWKPNGSGTTKPSCARRRRYWRSTVSSYSGHAICSVMGSFPMPPPSTRKRSSPSPMPSAQYRQTQTCRKLNQAASSA